MAEVALSPQARRDLFAILQYLLETAGARTARRYDDAFKDVVLKLSAHPGIGSPQAELGDETRTMGLSPYLIFYAGGPKSEAVHVLRILHGRRNITPELIARGRLP